MSREEYNAEQDEYDALDDARDAQRDYQTEAAIEQNSLARAEELRAVLIDIATTRLWEGA